MAIPKFKNISCKSRHVPGQKIEMDIHNSILPSHKLKQMTPSVKDGLSSEVEQDVRYAACETIQIACRLLRLPSVAASTACTLFQRFYSARSLIDNQLSFGYWHVSISCLGLASKIEEVPRAIRHIINVFQHIKWKKRISEHRRSTSLIPRSLLIDQNYMLTKKQIMKAEMTLLKELGFCVHVKSPHKFVVVYLSAMNPAINTMND